MFQLWFMSNTVLWQMSVHVAGLTLQLNVVVLILSGILWLIKEPCIGLSSIRIISVLLLCMLLSLVVAFEGPCTDKFAKAIITIPVLTLLVFIGLEVGRRSTMDDWSNLYKVATWAVVASFAGFLLELAMPALFPNQAGYRDTGRLSGLFSEPSLVAFSIFPCIALLLVSEHQRTKRLGTCGLCGLVMFSRSSTLIALIIAWLLYRSIIQRSWKRLAVGVGTVALFVVLGALIDYDSLVKPTVDRAVGVNAGSESSNLSSLIYVQGWQDAWANLLRTHGLGLGINMMGCHPLPDVPARMLLALGWPHLAELELNAQDGSVLFGKIVSEAGVVGIAFYVGVIWWWIRIETGILQKENRSQMIARQRAALIFCFVVTSFIRSSGYFSASLLCVAALCGSGASVMQQGDASSH